VIRKIITHDGVFHTDEVFAVALIQLVEDQCIIERTREITEDDYNDSTIAVVDVGGRYQPELNNFDHHQNTEEVKDYSAFGLVAMKYLPKYIYGNAEYVQQVISNINQNLVIPIDKWDNGLIQKNVPDDIIPLQQVFRVIQDIGDVSTFKVAVYMAQQMIKGYVRTASKTVDADIVWNRKKIVDKNIAVFGDFCMIWKIKSKGTTIKYAVWPEDSDIFVVSTVDSVEHPIADYNTRSRIFLHKAKFIAKYSKLQDAIDCAKKSNSIIV